MPKIQTPRCPHCWLFGEVEATMAQKAQFFGPNRPHVQHIFPELPPEEREMLISGIHPNCWAEMFA